MKQSHSTYVRCLETLWDMVSDMVEGGRLTEADIPDDYHALVNHMVALSGIYANQNRSHENV